MDPASGSSCTKCGASVTAGSSFCPRCGAPIAGAAEGSAASRPAGAGEPPASAGARRRLPFGRVLLAGALAVAVWWLFGRGASVRVVNRFDLPLTVTLPDGSTAAVAPNAARTIALPAPGFVRLAWSVPARTAAGGAVMGEAPTGEIRLQAGRGTTTQTIGLGEARMPMFEPLVTNEGTEPLRIVVNAGFATARSCQCVVPPGATRVRIGFYPLYRNTTVQAVDPAGRRATFRDLGPQVDPELGQVGLKFADRDFR